MHTYSLIYGERSNLFSLTTSKMLLTSVLLCLYLLSGSFSRAEPVCSKFHYEEKTLEKMIRQEILVEKMKADLEDTKQQVLDALVNLKNEREKFADDMKRKADDIEILRENMKEARDLVKSQIETNIEEYKAEMEEIRDSVVTPAIAFKARLVSDKTLSDRKVIVFTDNLFDTENAYNHQTGIFVAPVAGIYYFSAQLCLNSPAYIYFGVSLNDIIISKTLVGEKEWTKCYTIDALTSVAKGDKVSVKCTGSCGGDKLWEDTYSTSTFSGVLLHKQL